MTLAFKIYNNEIMKFNVMGQCKTKSGVRMQSGRQIECPKIIENFCARENMIKRALVKV